MSQPRPRSAIESLRAQIERLESKSKRVRSVLPFGLAAVDSRLPGGGLALGALHEVAGGGHGTVDGAAAALFAAGIAARTKGKVLWCITRPDLFAPALAQAGLTPDRVIYVEAGDDKTVLACVSPLRKMAGAMRESARSGARTAIEASGGTITGGSSDVSSAAASGPPAWAKRMKRSQSLQHGATAAAHAVRSGDSHGGGSSINLSESDR